jgi:uncharacterized protein (TIGR02996 family)
MAVYFVYRCDEMGPSDLHRRRFDDATLLDWYRRVWRPLRPDDDFSDAGSIFGDHGDEFYTLCCYVSQTGRPPPTRIEEVRDALRWDEFTEIRYEEHCVQVLDDNGEPDAALYFFDDAFVEKHPGLTAYLLHDGPLPDGAGEPGWAPSDPAIRDCSPWRRRVKGEGRVYAFATVHMTYGEFYSELDVGDVITFDGLRLPRFCRWLMSKDPEEVDEWGHAWGELGIALAADDLGEGDQERSFLAALRDDPDDEAAWSAYADWLMERGDSSPGARLLRLALARQNGLYDEDPARNVVRVGEHAAEAFVASGKGCDHLFFFDDLWGAAHPALADALLRYGSRWDVLSTGDERTD